jgi:2-oxoglutarate dehydrogenase E2 component (dihydrolipoamide succinyltransferase)
MKKNIASTAVKGTGKDGRITKDDAATPSMGTPTGGSAHLSVQNFNVTS